MDNQVTISGCSYMVLVVRTWNKVNGVEFHSQDMKIYGCLSDNYISILGCLANVLVVPAHGQPKFRTLF